MHYKIMIVQTAFLICLFRIIDCSGPKKAPFFNPKLFFSEKSTGQYRPEDFF
jgi:hypothetical protein